MPENEHVRRTLHQILKQQPDIGAAKTISDWFFESANMFDPNAGKKPKPEVVMALAYVALMAAVSAAFNLL
jgi:hypothetical protein